MKSFMEKVKKYKLRSVCIGLSAFLFGFIAVSVFNNVGDTYAASTDLDGKTCPDGWSGYIDGNGLGYVCCPKGYFQRSNDFGKLIDNKYGYCLYTGSTDGILYDGVGSNYKCSYGSLASYNGSYYCRLEAKAASKNRTWYFYPNASTSGTYGAKWTSSGSGIYALSGGGVSMTCSGSSCTNKVTSLPTITRTGYILRGWSTDSKCSNLSSLRPPMSITSNLNFYACWKAVDACYACGSAKGSGYYWGKYAGSSSCNIHTEYATESACLANNPDKADGQTTNDFIFESSSKDPDVIAGTIQYYKIVYDLNGGKLIDGKTSKTQYVRGDKAVGTPNTNPIKSGYAFVQWEYNGSGFDFNTKLDDIKSNLTTITENDVTLYTITLKAIYTELDYSDMECPSGTVLDPSVKKCYSVLSDSSYPSYTINTYSAGTRFCYAYNNSQGKPGGIAIHSVAEADCPAAGTTGTGSKGYCTIEGKNNRNDGKYSEYSGSDTWMSENSCFVASPCTSDITNSSACKVKWDKIIYNVSDAKINEVTLPEEPVDTTPDDDVTPTPKTYTITYDANGGSEAPSSQTKTENVDLTLSDTKPTREGYTFVNWNTKKDGTGTSYNAGDTYKQNANVTLYAQYQEELNEGDKTYTVTFWMNDGTNKKEQKVINIGDKVVKPSDPIREGYTFEGWYNKKEKGTQYDFSKEVTSNINLYAHWEKESNKDKTNDEITNNSKTGDVLIFVAWVIGIGALTYSVYYFKLKKDNI